MPLKIYFSDSIHRQAKLPPTLQDFMNSITDLYSSHLPEAWVLQYVDSEGDKVNLSHVQDYEELLNLEKANNTFTIKVYVIPVGSNQKSPSVTGANPSSQKLEGESVLVTQNENELLLTGSQVKKEIVYPVLDEQPVGPKDNNLSFHGSQYQEEQMAIANPSLIKANFSVNSEIPSVQDSKQEISKSQVNPLPQKRDKVSNESRIKLREAMHLTKKLAKGKFSPEEATQATIRLEELEAGFSTEEKQLLEDKKQKTMKKFNERNEKKDRIPEENWKKVREAMHLSKMLAKGRFSPEEAIQATVRLNELEAGFNVEEKQRLENKKQKAMTRFNERNEKKDKISEENWRKLREAMHLTKMLAKGKFSPEEATQAAVRLNELETGFNVEEKQLFEAKKQKAMTKFNERNEKKDKIPKENWRKLREAMHLTKMLSKGKFSPEEATQATVRLNELEAGFSAEEKQLLEVKKQKAIAKLNERNEKRDKRCKRSSKSPHSQEGKREKKSERCKNHKKERKSFVTKGFKNFQKLRILLARGKIHRLGKVSAKLVSLLPEENVQAFAMNLSTVLKDFRDSKSENQKTDFVIPEKELANLEEMFLEYAGAPEQKERRVEEWKAAQESWKAKLEKKASKHSKKEKHYKLRKSQASGTQEGFNGSCKNLIEAL